VDGRTLAARRYRDIAIALADEAGGRIIYRSRRKY
jgi:hypothetical protein